MKQYDKLHLQKLAGIKPINEIRNVGKLKFKFTDKQYVALSNEQMTWLDKHFSTDGGDSSFYGKKLIDVAKDFTNGDITFETEKIYRNQLEDFDE